MFWRRLTSARPPAYYPSADSDVVAEVPSTSPPAPSACTARYGPVVPDGNAIAVSKPLRAVSATDARADALAPASSRHEATCVAPFQLAYTVVLPSFWRTAPTGGESGDPTSAHFDDQAARYADGDLREVYFYPSQLTGHTEREYHPH